MRIFIADDDPNVVMILEKIIVDKKLGDVVGSAYDGLTASEEIEITKPDLVLIDLLMPGKDGINVVKEAKQVNKDIQFIMISQVSSKDMISKAYLSGIEFYISKPIDAIEVQMVIKKVEEKINMDKKLSQIQNLFTGQDHNNRKEYTDNLANIKRVMQRIGVLGETGSQDILRVAEYLLETGQNMSDFTIGELLGKLTDNPKTMEQRIRRTASVGMVNLANLGLEDYMNEIFTEYSNALFNFEQLKIEMDFIRGKSKKRGSINLKKFLDGIVYYGKMS